MPRRVGEFADGPWLRRGCHARSRPGGQLAHRQALPACPRCLPSLQQWPSGDCLGASRRLGTPGSAIFRPPARRSNQCHCYGRSHRWHHLSHRHHCCCCVASAPASPPVQSQWGGVASPGPTEQGGWARRMGRLASNDVRGAGRCLLSSLRPSLSARPLAASHDSSLASAGEEAGCVSMLQPALGGDTPGEGGESCINSAATTTGLFLHLHPPASSLPTPTW